MEEQEGLVPLTDSQQRAVEAATEDYQFELAMAADVLEYLKGRGLDQAAVAGSRLGLVGEPHAGHYGRQGWLALPYLDRHGKALTIRFRCLEDHEHTGHGKYMSVFEDPSRVFNIGAIHRAEAGVDGKHGIHITEGELDALVLQRVGLHAIAIPGASGWQPHHRKMLAGFNEVTVWPDGDEAGDKFARKVVRSIRIARVVKLPKGQDVTAVYVKGGHKAVLQLLEGLES